MDINSILVFGLPALLLVTGLVEFCKKLGLSGQWCVVAAVCFGVLVMLVQQLAVVYPQIAPWMQAVFWGVIIGLAAAGLYDVVKQFRPQA